MATTGSAVVVIACWQWAAGSMGWAVMRSTTEIVQSVAQSSRNPKEMREIVPDVFFTAYRFHQASGLLCT